MKALITSLVSRRMIAILLTLLVGIFIAINFNEGVDIVCSLAEVLLLQIDGCVSLETK